MTLYYLAILCIVGLMELISVGYEASSLKSLLHFDTSVRWDVFSTLLYLLGADFIILNIYLFGFHDTISAAAKTHAGFLHFIKASFFSSLFIFIVYDFLCYWHHRLSHRWDWLWISHKYHHSATEMNMLVTMRSHPLQVLFREKTLITFLFGYLLFNNVFFVAHMIVNVLSHSKLQSHFGVIGRYVVISPRYHHLHHDIHVENKNYSTGLVMWDRIFGTYLDPTTNSPKQFGIVDASYTLNKPITVFLRPFVDFTIYPALKTCKHIKHTVFAFVAK